MSINKNMNKSRKEKNDEFYTLYESIEAEAMKYREQFEGKVVLCNCDDPEWSNFWQFFHQNFYNFKLKKLISTHYVENGSSYAMIFDGTRDKKEPLTRDEKIENMYDYSLFDMCSLESNGDFRSDECIKYLEEADIVCTNPPFSLFREYINQLLEYNKKFLIIGNFNAISYKEIFPFIKENKIWLGYNTRCTEPYIVPKDSKTMSIELTKKMRKKYPHYSDKFFGAGSITSWFTNLDNNRIHEEIPLWKEYNEKDYKRYDNYNAIDIEKTNNIPCDYYGYMGVPITFLEKYNPNQFEIIKFRKGNDNNDLIINKKCPYFRVLIRRKYDNEGRLVKDNYDDDGNFIGKE